MRLLVTGGRHLDDVALIHRALILIHAQSPLSVLIHGGHAILGAAVEDWARNMRLHVLRYPANWRELGKRAEGIRNDFMLADSRPDLVLAFPGGNDTRALVLGALRRGLRVFDPCGQRIDHGQPEVADPDPEPEPGCAHPRLISTVN